MAADSSITISGDTSGSGGVATAAQLRYLARGLTQPGGKLPLFDEQGQAVPVEIVHACIARGLATPWFANPIKPDWLVCRLTDRGRNLVGVTGVSSGDAAAPGYPGEPVAANRLAANDVG